MTVLVHLGHPAHFHLFKHAVEAWRAGGDRVEVVIKSKDVLERLLDERGWAYHNVQAGPRATARLGQAATLLRRTAAVWRIARRVRPDVMIGTSAEIAFVGRLLGVPSVVTNEDDWDVVPLFARLAYPAATLIAAPSCCRQGRWRGKTAAYESYHELAYLHPDRFTPDPAVARALAPDGRPYALLRFARLDAHHDDGRAGIGAGVAARLVERIAPHARVYITSERELEPEFEPLRLQIPAGEVHSALAGAALYVGDSQTMAAEAAVLGTPALRFNDFVGEISYLEELEHRYGLTRGIRSSEPDALLDAVGDWLAQPDLAAEWQRRRQAMLRDKDDLTTLLVQLARDVAHGADLAAPRAAPA